MGAVYSEASFWQNLTLLKYNKHRADQYNTYETLCNQLESPVWSKTIFWGQWNSFKFDFSEQ